MNIQHLRYFLKVMETGSISRAAGLLGVTQPTLSVALKRIEQEFGARLFAPDGRGIRPLAGAKLLEDRVRLAVRVLSEAKRNLTGSAPAALKIGLLQSLAENWLPRLGNAWDGPVAIVEALSDELEKQVRGGAIDLALTALSPGERLPHRVLFHEPYMLFVGPMHLFAGRRTVGLAELDRQPFVLRQCCERLGSGRRLLDAALVRFKVVAKTRQEATAAALVAAGVGCTLAPKSWFRPGLRAVKVEGLSLERTVGLIWKTKANEGRAAGIARNLGPSMTSDTPVPGAGRLRDGSHLRTL
jgi:DNA-binding transcriptional LysR family regulator